jgi:cell fate regulator YaaT (PSP1 superfamily)
MYAVEFKAGRTEVFYVVEGSGIQTLSVGDWVIVEADRGEDLGKISSTISIDRLKQLISMTIDVTTPEDIDKLAATVEPEHAAILYAKEIVPKRIHRIATPSDLRLLQAKAQEEAIAMVRCQSRIRQKRLPMEVVDAEYQWDRNKITFFFQSDTRIDFRELVRDLFRIYKTRIWMCAVDKNRLVALEDMRKNIDMEAVHAAALAADAACQD